MLQPLLRSFVLKKFLCFQHQLSPREAFGTNLSLAHLPSTKKRLEQLQSKSEKLRKLKKQWDKYSRLCGCDSRTELQNALELCKSIYGFSREEINTTLL